ncbi:MAG: 4,5-dihydroxyphthalate decarboxylase [Alphaproteobacteria bacterium]|nr:4,5-dihydroxyphthalate decarboxylase [Alphaproteobacteria bacterium]
MTRVPLTLAVSEYDHVTDLVSGRVPVEGVDLTCLTLQIEEIFFRAFVYRDFDASEVSMAKLCSTISQGDNSLAAIPVFPSRVPRHSSIYIRRDGPVKDPSDLAGRKVGLPEWAQTAAVYSRGLLVHHYGIPLTAIEWVQAGVDQPGRTEKVKLNLPAGVKLTPRPDKSLNEMLISGEVDAILSAHAPSSFDEGHPNIGRMFEDFLAVEMNYVKQTGIFPIMHAVAIRRDVVERHPWIAMNLFKAFEEAKNRSVARMQAITSTTVPIPWCYEFARRAKTVFGDDPWPYGIEANRQTLDAFLQYAHEQGVCHRRLTPEDLFLPQVQKSFRV